MWPVAQKSRINFIREYLNRIKTTRFLSCFLIISPQQVASWTAYNSYLKTFLAWFQTPNIPGAKHFKERPKAYNAERFSPQLRNWIQRISLLHRFGFVLFIIITKKSRRKTYHFSYLQSLFWYKLGCNLRRSLSRRGTFQALLCFLFQFLVMLQYHWNMFHTQTHLCCWKPKVWFLKTFSFASN